MRDVDQKTNQDRAAVEARPKRTSTEGFRWEYAVGPKVAVPGGRRFEPPRKGDIGAVARFCPPPGIEQDLEWFATFDEAWGELCDDSQCVWARWVR